MTSSLINDSHELTSEVVLVGISDNSWCDIFPLQSENRLRLGRGGDNQIVVMDNRCSRNHAEIDCRDGKWFIRDLKSRNGTYVNGLAVDHEQRIQIGDRIRIGRRTFELAPNLQSHNPEGSSAEGPSRETWQRIAGRLESTTILAPSDGSRASDSGNRT